MRGKRRRTGINVAVLFAGSITMLVMPRSAWAGGGGGCYGGPTEGSRSLVSMEEACFGPTINRVAVGTRVTWINKDPYPHVVTGDTWGSPDDLQQGDRFSSVFRSPGVYPYTCYIHPGMIGAVIVGDAVAADVGAGGLTPLGGADLNGEAPGARAPAKPVSARPAVVRTSAGPWPATTAIGFALSFVLGLGLIAQRRSTRKLPEPES